MAYVLSSVSGNLISAASAGFAPTNSADVSAIASAYQVVSATATQLYAGTAYITSVNDAPISAARAGNAANASMANSAYYDGTGRLISALPDSATVSAIASSYAESAASSKLDATAYDSAEFYTTSNPSGFVDATSASAIASAYQVVSSVGTSQNGPKSIVTGINGLFISARYADTANEARKDGSGRTISSLPDSAAVSAIASSYAESAASSKQDTLTFGYNTADQISSIDGSALGGMDEAAVSAIASAYAESAASSKQDTLTFGYDAENKISSIDGSALAGGEQIVTSLQYATSQSGAIVGSTTGDNAGYGNKAFSARYYPDQGWYNYQSATALAAVGVTSVDSTITGNTEYPFEIFMIPYGATNYGNIQDITSVGSYMNNYGQFNDTSDFRIATGMATLSGYSAILDFNVTSLPFNTQYGPPMWGTAGGMVLDENENCKPVFTVVCGSGSYNEGRCAPIADGPKALGFGAITTVSAVSGINELGIAGGAGGGIDSATCSAIASAYAESAVSSYVPYSSLEYNTASAISGINGSALAAGSTYSAGEGIDITDDVISVETPVDIVAGPGIVVDNPDGNTLRVSVAQAEEVVLWEGSLTEANCMQAFDLNDNPFNFEYLRFYWNVDNCSMVTEGRVITGNVDVCSDFGWFYQNWKTIKNMLHFTAPVGSTPANAQFIEGISYAQATSSVNMYDFRHNWSYCFKPLVKIVGIHRIANN